MATSTAQQAQLLFKAAQGKSSTNTVRDFFEEPIDGRPIVYPTNIWAEAVRIPATAPGGVDAAVTGIVKRFIDKTLTAVLGTTNSFSHPDLVDCIPFNTGDGSYNYLLKDSAGTTIPFGLGDWLVDPNTGTLTFYGTVPGNMPPKLSFYKYVGSKGTLPPRYTTTEIAAIAAPVAGQQVYDSTLNQYKFYNGTAWTALGSGSSGGSGEGGINYVKNGRAETDTTGWTVYNNTFNSIDQATGGVNTTLDAVYWLLAQGFIINKTPVRLTSTGTLPAPLVAGTTYYVLNPNVAFGPSRYYCSFSLTPGGAAIDLTTTGTGVLTIASMLPGSYGANGNAPTGVTWTRSLAPDSIRELASFKLTKDAVNRMGHGARFELSIDAVDIGKTVGISFETRKLSGTFVEGDVLVAVYDNLNDTIPSTWILPVPSLDSADIRRFTITPTAAYAFLAFHIATPSVLAYEVLFDSIKVEPLNGAVLAAQTNPDSYYQSNTWTTAGGTSWVNAIRLVNPGFTTMQGDAFQIIDDTAFGLTVKVLRDSFFVLQFASDPTGVQPYLFTKNLTANYTTLTCPAANKLGQGYGDAMSMSWSGPLVKDDLIRILGNDSTVQSTGYNTFSVAAAGSIKQVLATINQKLTIPTSEVKFTSASTRGSTDTYTIKYDTMNFIRGDAFEIINTVTNGTVLKMKKSGVINTSASFGGSTPQALWITKNQVNLNATPTYDEIMASGTASGNNYAAVGQWTGRVVVGDLIRITTSPGVTQTSANYNVWTALFWEDQVNLAISTLQPQFNQSDSVVRATGSSGNGSTNTSVIRFSNLSINFGSAIAYQPSATLGDSWLINEDGVYDFKAIVGNTGNSINYAVVRGSLVTWTDTNTTPADSLGNMPNPSAGTLATISGQEFLPAGTLVRVVSQAANISNMTQTSFTISKVGKPNLTSVDVTPFATNYKTLDFEHGILRGYAGGGSNASYAGINRFTNVDAYTNKGIVQIVQDSVLGDSLKALKTCNLNISFTHANGGASGSFIISKNATVFTGSVTSVPAQQRVAFGYIANYGNTITAELQLIAGDVIRFHTDTAGDVSQRVTFLASADTDSVISPTKQLSSDTMNFVYKASALGILDATTDAIGTFTTYTYGANSNAILAGTGAPTQTLASMNSNGLQVFARAYNAASTLTSPSRIDVVVGAGLKSMNVLAYAGAAKTSPASIDQLSNGTAAIGTSYYYDEVKGVLTIEAGVARFTTETSKNAAISAAGNAVSNVFIVFNVTTAGALVAAPQMQKRIAYLKDVKANGTAGQALTANAYTVRNLNTVEDPTGIIDSLNTGTGGFTLKPGVYAIRAKASWYTNATAGNKARSKIVNSSTTTDAILGANAYQSAGAADPMLPLFVEGVLTVTTAAHIYNLQSRVTAGSGGVAESFGESEVYSIVEIEKLN